MGEWSIAIPGDPPSVNHTYFVVRGSRRMAKDPRVEQYQTIASYFTKLATHDFTWNGGFIRLRYEFYLARDKDTDNMLKALNDAIASALDVNDRWFLPCVISKEKSTDPHVRVTLIYPVEG